MKILVIGSGAREHAIVWKFAQSQKVTKIFSAPGNCGMENLAQQISISNCKDLLQFAKSEKIDITFVGPEQPLADGIVDEFTHANLPIIGPTKLAAEIESSKVFAKNFMKKYKIPTATYKAFTEIKPALYYIRKKTFPIVIKVDGLAAGKGVFISQNYTEAEIILNHLIHFNILGKAGQKVVIEEFLYGEEASLFAFCDGKNFVSTILSQDHKSLNDGDSGPNTGGMGAYAPAVFPKNYKKKIDDTIIFPALNGMAKESRPFRGILYAGVIFTKNGPKVLEFNCRLGDPETQVILPLMENDLVDICKAILKNRIDRIKLKWKNQSAVAVVLASDGYPGKYQEEKEITGLEGIDKKNLMIFFSGIKKEREKYITNGGRVMSVTAIADTLPKTKEKAYKNLEKISFAGMHFRSDISDKGLRKLSSTK